MQAPSLPKVGSTSNNNGPFEAEVFKTLLDWGYAVDRNVGMGGFHMDLAIRHPEIPNRYLAGIICDGKNYSSALTARDRERLRPQILKNMNWKLIKLWAKEWMLKPSQSRQVLKNLIEEARNGDIDPEEIRDSIDPIHLEEVGPSSEFSNTVDNGGRNIKTIASEINVDWKQKIKMTEYASYKPPHQFPSYQYGHDQQQGINLLVEIIKLEQPIHEDILYDRFRLCYGLDGTSKYQKQLFQKILLTAIRAENLSRKNSFIQITSNDYQPTPRYPSPGELPRKIEYISIEEISALLKEITTHVYGISTSALIKETSSLLGYPNASSTRKERIEIALNELLKQGIIRLSGESVVPVINTKAP